MDPVYAAACMHGRDVSLKINNAFLTMTASEYLKWYAMREYHVIADSTFAYPSDFVFESLLSSEYRIANMWRKDLLAHWYWQNARTGIASVHERLCALEHAACVKRPLLAGRTDAADNRCGHDTQGGDVKPAAEQK